MVEINADNEAPSKQAENATGEKYGRWNYC
jgi:hypothetical protein